MKEKYKNAIEIEKIQMAVVDSKIQGQGEIKEENLKKSLESYQFIVEEKLIRKNSNYIFNVEGRKYRIESNGNVKLIFDENTFKIGSAKSIDNYGKLVKFRSENGISDWRLFYQDENYSYLIYDDIYIGEGNTGYSSYKDGSYVSNIGQRLSQKINNLFSTNNTNANIRKTAYLLDTEFWGKNKKFEDEEGIAIFAIASPTIELFTASYNAASKIAESSGNYINIEADSIGYVTSETSGYFLLSDRNGIYNLENGQYWLASPYNIEFHNYRIIGR